MAKKKNTNLKNHRFKHTYIEANERPEISGSAKVKQGMSDVSAVAAVYDSRFGYVAADIRRIFVFAAILIVVIVGLWLVVTYTKFGGGIYNLIRL